ncbi:MAG: DUF523 domain-containing protein [Culicoidibacterales bacterium]
MKTMGVSGCICGQPCRYDGASKGVIGFVEADQWQWQLFCPEQAGGLPTPRIAAEIVGGDGYAVLNGTARVLTRTGVDVTQAFLRGAYQTLTLLQKQTIKTVVLKQKSPSCGSGQIYDGSFSGMLRQGDGVTTALLRIHGYEIFDENVVQKQ